MAAVKMRARERKENTLNRSGAGSGQRWRRVAEFPAISTTTDTLTIDTGTLVAESETLPSGLHPLTPSMEPSRSPNPDRCSVCWFSRNTCRTFMLMRLCCMYSSTAAPHCTAPGRSASNTAHRAALQPRPSGSSASIQTRGTA
uniref:Uncharacterized protein n=1 Tax=Anopheles coluzzii TaxID=1518534 RepID=A0A8W7PZ24_ANOCL